MICYYLMEQLLKSRHCGAYELAYTGFVIICEQLWKEISIEKNIQLVTADCSF